MESTTIIIDLHMKNLVVALMHPCWNSCDREAHQLCTILVSPHRDKELFKCAFKNPRRLVNFFIIHWRFKFACTIPRRYSIWPSFSTNFENISCSQPFFHPLYYFSIHELMHIILACILILMPRRQARVCVPVKLAEPGFRKKCADYIAYLWRRRRDSDVSCSSSAKSPPEAYFVRGNN